MVNALSYDKYCAMHNFTDEVPSTLAKRRCRVDPVLIITGIMLCLGFTYWWQQKVAAIAGIESMHNSFGCLVSAGMHRCPPDILDYLQQDVWQASLFFYAGIAILIYSVVNAKPPHIPSNPL